MEISFLQMRISCKLTDLGVMTFHFHGFSSRVSCVLEYTPDGVCCLFNLLQFAQNRVAYDWELHEGTQAKTLSNIKNGILSPKMNNSISSATCYSRALLKGAIHTTVKLKMYFQIVFILNRCIS